MLLEFENNIYDLSRKVNRRLLYENVIAAFSYIQNPKEKYFNELNKIIKLINLKDKKGLIEGFFMDGVIHFNALEKRNYLECALKEAGYNVKKLNKHQGFYVINDLGNEVRINDYDQSSVTNANVIIYEHDYNDLTIVKNIVALHDLKSKGFSRLNKLNKRKTVHSAITPMSSSG